MKTHSLKNTHRYSTGTGISNIDHFICCNVEVELYEILKSIGYSDHCAISAEISNQGTPESTNYLIPDKGVEKYLERKILDSKEPCIDMISKIIDKKNINTMKIM